MCNNAPGDRRRVRAWSLGFVLLSCALIAGGCGLSDEEDDWCAGHLEDVKRAIPEDRLRDYVYMDDTWKDACRRAYAQR